MRAIDQAGEIILFARGLSTHAAVEMMKKLQLFHKPVTLHDDYKYMTYYASFVKENSLIINLSLSGETLELIEATEVAKPMVQNFDLDCNGAKSISTSCRCLPNWL